MSLVVQKSCVPSWLGAGAVTGNYHNPFYSTIIFPARWPSVWYLSAAPCGIALLMVMAEPPGRTNTLFIDFLLLPTISAVCLSVLFFFSHAVAKIYP